MNLIDYKGTLIREGNGTDKSMVKDCHAHYSSFNLDENSIVLDLGANIGGFAKMCQKHKIKRYVGYEPSEDNCQVLRENTKGLENYEVIHGSVSTKSNEYIKFIQTGAKNKDCSGSVTRKARIGYDVALVRNYTFDSVFDSIKPTHVKMDIEGAEYSWFESNRGIIPDCIQEIAVELHGVKMYRLFDAECIINLKKHFDLQRAIPNVGFTKPESPLVEYPNMGVKIRCGTIFGIDLFLRRKI